MTYTHDVDGRARLILMAEEEAEITCRFNEASPDEPVLPGWCWTHEAHDCEVWAERVCPKLLGAACYTPYRFYRICPESQHTCTERECLAGSPECPKAAKPATVPDAGGPTAPGRGWEYTGDWC